MLETTDLKRNNIVDKDGQLCTIAEINTNSVRIRLPKRNISDSLIPLNFISGVRLNATWLQKANFGKDKKYKENYFSIPLPNVATVGVRKLVVTNYNKNESRCLVGLSETMNDNENIVNLAIIDFVHQLQNIYSVLAQKELLINL